MQIDMAVGNVRKIGASGRLSQKVVIRARENWVADTRSVTRRERSGLSVRRRANGKERMESAQQEERQNETLAKIK